MIIVFYQFYVDLPPFSGRCFILVSFANVWKYFLFQKKEISLTCVKSLLRDVIKILCSLEEVRSNFRKLRTTLSTEFIEGIYEGQTGFPSSWVVDLIIRGNVESNGQLPTEMENWVANLYSISPCGKSGDFLPIFQFIDLEIGGENPTTRKLK